MSRDILAPPLLRIGNNRCYRVNLVHDDWRNPAGQQITQQQQPTQQSYVEQDLYDDNDEEDETAYTIEELANGMLSLSMHVPQSFYGGIIGFKGSTKRRIESETQTEIYIPRSREGGGGGGSNANKSEDITIKGKTRSAVCTARRKIMLLVLSLRKRMRPTHFLCIALNYGEIRKNFVELKKKILDANLPGVDEELFQSDGFIHITLGCCVLLDDAERAKGVELLESCRQLLADLKTPFDIKVDGLEIMNDDPSAVRVLYACIEAPDLQRFANLSLRIFQKAGLANHEQFKREDNNVKLHMTLMNSRYRNQNNAKAANSFDAREILKRFGDFDFGSTKNSEVQLCVLNSSNQSSGDFYKITGSLKF